MGGNQSKQGGAGGAGGGSGNGAPKHAAPKAPKGGGAAAEQKKDESGFTMNNKMTVDDFDLLAVVGKGSFGKVMQVRKKDTGEVFALKVLKKAHLVARKQVAHTRTERRVLENFDHPFIVSLRFAFQTPDKLYMVLDYFTGGELFFHLKNSGRFTEDRAMLYAAEIVSALEALHQRNVVYRDLKPENVLLDEDGHVRLTDFGLSKESVSESQLTHTFCGTPEYLAPEVIHGKGYNQAVDWWSLGTLLYEMLTGLPPFYNQNLHVMYEKIIRGKLTFPKYVSKDAKGLLEGLLQRDPNHRFKLKDIKAHPFFKTIDWEKLLKKEYVPPFKPKVSSGKMELGNVDEEFLAERPKDTPAQPSAMGGANAPHFQGFTYEEESGLAGGDDDTL